MDMAAHPSPLIACPSSRHGPPCRMSFQLTACEIFTCMLNFENELVSSLDLHTNHHDRLPLPRQNKDASSTITMTEQGLGRPPPWWRDDVHNGNRETLGGPLCLSPKKSYVVWKKWNFISLTTSLLFTSRPVTTEWEGPATQTRAGPSLPRCRLIPYHRRIFAATTTRQQR